MIYSAAKRALHIIIIIISFFVLFSKNIPPQILIYKLDMLNNNDFIPIYIM